MEAGRELDQIVAEKVMGLLKIGKSFALNQTDLLEIPHYSTSIADAWEVVEKMKASKCELQLLSSNNFWNAIVYCDDGKQVKAQAGTAPHAICLAALAAVGVKL